MARHKMAEMARQNMGPREINVVNADTKEVSHYDEIERMATSCEFDARRYADAYPDLKNAFGYDENQLMNHYRQYGRHEGRSPCGDPNRQKIAEMARQKIAKMARHKMGRRG